VLNGGVESFARDGDATVARLPGERELRGSHVLLASGRVPNTEELQLDRAGVETSRGYVVVDDRQRTNVGGIWAAGDVATGPQFTPVAQYQARISIDDMFGTGMRRADYSVLPTAIFTDPELGSVGLTEKEARDEGHDVDVVKQPLPNLTRAQYTRTKHGLFKIVFDPSTRKVLGVHVVSRGASDIVGGLAPALRLGVTVADLAYMHHVYPSYSEGVKAAAEKALA
jgi:pyruvate/2-oxoglutarate dehydrogenase complex dihydrolipoamide dehydrogenase (E3) component